MVRIRSALVPAVDERMIPDATIVIVTKDRRDEALRAVASAVTQTAAVEVQRNPERVWFYGTRNDVLFTWYYVPARYLVPRLAKVTAHLLWLGFGVRRPGLFMRALLAGYRTSFTERRRREPVPPALYRVFRRLGYAPEAVEAIEHDLPELREPARTKEHVRA